MLPSGPTTRIGGAPSISSSFLRSNSSVLGSQGGSVHLQETFSSLISPQSQYSMSLLGSNPNMSSLLNQNFGNGSNTGLSGLGAFQRSSVDTTPESVASDISFAASSFTPSNVSNIGSSLQGQNQEFANNAGNGTLLDQHQSNVQQFQQKKFQRGQQLMHQFPVSNLQVQQQQSPFQSLQHGSGVMVPVKTEPQLVNNSIGLQEQLQSLRNLGSMKLESQKDQIVRGMGPVKLEDRHSDQAAVLKQRMQQQQFLQMSRQPLQATAAQMNLLQQQRFFQLHQHQQQELLKTFPLQQPQLQRQPQNMISRSAAKPAYEPGMCARRLTQYTYQQQHRPDNNNIEFWRKFVAEFFDPSAKKRWCVSLYGNSRQTNGIFPQDTWHCEICNRKPGRGFETTVEVLPRLFKLNYDSGTLEELLYVDMPREYQNEAGQIVLDYAKAVQESVFEHLRVVRDGQLRIVFSPDMKICSWEFCARRHEELIPRRLIIPQVSQLGAVAQKYQASAQSALSNLPAPDLQSNCNMFVASARQLVRALEMPLVNDLGYTKRYVRCLQISEVVNSMKDLIDYSRETGKGPIESLATFPRKTSRASGLLTSQQPDEKQQSSEQIFNNDHHSAQASTMQPSTSSGVSSVSNSHGMASTTTSATTIAGLLHQNSMNSRIENQMNNPSSPYVGTPVQIPSAGSSTTLPAAQPNPSSPFSSSTLSSSNNPNQISQNASTASATTGHINSTSSAAPIPVQQSSQINDSDLNKPPSSLEKLLQEILNSPQFGEAADAAAPCNPAVNNAKRLKRCRQEGQNLPTSGNCLGGNSIANKSSAIMGGGFGNLGVQNGPSTTNGRIGAAMGSNLATLAGRVGMPSMHQEASINNQQQELANRFLNGIGAMNSFNNLQYDWKSA
ncbi:SEUSS transcriptional co-regulator isoform 1 [Tripterygium wilfordii]|uniref:SEUSS transcriptional co-regulator isoform 1 n=1 Tax=Tripterygium wilfordii TaxID=458696 RepID=A0A7J7E0E9_TRIWF|nr:transcriptional corepressor SEUSS-like [Tripterygium wilfordii]XP_038679976.1 transcriptional corepressor SEUSS-like [Tripterygium wilfordii]XP_038679984.1 transcriptional corepressor SEUSS-like [Tripterygium wilfordii]KAF5751796.1 SEUSS transcriptional co-regulator isoform 1 [Tripterygium wilfordii]